MLKADSREIRMEEGTELPGFPDKEQEEAGTRPDKREMFREICRPLLANLGTAHR